MTEKIEESHDFARQVQREVYTRVTKVSGAQRDRGIKKAPFVVLIGANMPSVLAEISFLTNPRDERLLKRSDYREKIAYALYEGILGYVKNLGEVRDRAAGGFGSNFRLPPGRISDILNLMARIFVKHAWLVAVLTALPFLCSAQEKPSVRPVMPATDWRQVEFRALPLSAISAYGGDPAVEREYGVKALELRTYQLGKTQMTVVVEPALDATSAYGLLTFYQTPAMTSEKGIQLAVGDANQTLMARGNNFIRFLHGKNPPPSGSDYQALLVFRGGAQTVSERDPGVAPPDAPEGIGAREREIPPGTRGGQTCAVFLPHGPHRI